MVGRMSDPQPITIRPERDPLLEEAVAAGGGVLVKPAEAVGLVWTHPAQPDDLDAFLCEHPQIRWVQLPWAGIEPYLPVIRRHHDRTWSSAAGVYAETGGLVGQLQHTELLRRRTILDRVFVTPSNHRVHHGSNKEYLDKNFGSMLIVWDRVFGTFAPETVPARYGLAGGKRVAGPVQALAGGYPALLAGVRAQDGVTACARYLVAAP